jgi:hypothetical protein
VEIPGEIQWREIPDNLLIQHNKTTIPEVITYGEALQLWAEDRAIVETQNGQLSAIRSLGEPDPL